MNKKKRPYFGSLKIDTYLSRISSLSVFARIDGKRYMGVYIGIQRKSKSKKVTQKGFEFESISFNAFSNERFSIGPSVEKKSIYRKKKTLYYCNK